MKNCYHNDEFSSNQCGSSLVQTIEAPLGLVWSLIRRFDNPQAYKRFIKTCNMRGGNGGIGSVREVHVVSGLPAKTSVEKLEELDDDSHVMVFSIVSGDHRLANYRSTTTVNEGEGDGGKTVVTESYMVDVPMDSTEEDTCLFVDTIIRLNLMSLARITEEMVCEY